MQSENKANQKTSSSPRVGQHLVTLNLTRCANSLSLSQTYSMKTPRVAFSTVCLLVTGCHDIAQAGLRLILLLVLPWSPKCRDLKIYWCHHTQLVTHPLCDSDTLWSDMCWWRGKAGSRDKRFQLHLDPHQSLPFWVTISLHVKGWLWMSFITKWLVRSPEFLAHDS